MVIWSHATKAVVSLAVVHKLMTLLIFSSEINLLDFQKMVFHVHIMIIKATKDHGL